jgi:hypothetical protein
MARETMSVIEAGGYRSAAGRDVKVSGGVADAVAGTRLYLPGEALGTPPVRADAGLPVIEVA